MLAQKICILLKHLIHIVNFPLSDRKCKCAADSPILLIPNSVLYQDIQHFCLWYNHLIRITFLQSQLSVFTTNGFEGRRRPLQTPACGMPRDEPEAQLSMKLVLGVFLQAQAHGQWAVPRQAAVVVLRTWQQQNHLGSLLKCKFLGSNPDLKIRILGGMSQAFVF